MLLQKMYGTRVFVVRRKLYKDMTYAETAF